MITFTDIVRNFAVMRFAMRNEIHCHPKTTLGTGMIRTYEFVAQVLFGYNISCVFSESLGLTLSAMMKIIPMIIMTKMKR